MLSAFGRLSSRDGKASAFFGMRAARRQSRRGFDCTHAVTAGGSGDSTVTTKSFFVVESLGGIVTRRPRPLGSVTPAKAGGIKPDPHLRTRPDAHHASLFISSAPRVLFRPDSAVIGSWRKRVRLRQASAERPRSSTSFPPEVRPPLPSLGPPSRPRLARSSDGGNDDTLDNQ